VLSAFVFIPSPNPSVVQIIDKKVSSRKLFHHKGRKITFTREERKLRFPNSSFCEDILALKLSDLKSDMKQQENRQNYIQLCDMTFKVQ
jgi:hypothetical protein